MSPPSAILSTLEEIRLENQYFSSENSTTQMFQSNLFIPLVNTVIAIDKSKNLYEYIKDNNLENDIDKKIEEVHNNFNQNCESQENKTLTKLYTLSK